MTQQNQAKNGLRDFKEPSKLSNCFGKTSEEAPNMDCHKMLNFLK